MVPMWSQFSPAFLWVLEIGGKFGGRCPQLLTKPMVRPGSRASAGAVFLALLLVSFLLEPELGLHASLSSVPSCPRRTACEGKLQIALGKIASTGSWLWLQLT